MPSSHEPTNERRACFTVTIGGEDFAWVMNGEATEICRSRLGRSIMAVLTTIDQEADDGAVYAVIFAGAKAAGALTMKWEEYLRTVDFSDAIDFTTRVVPMINKMIQAISEKNQPREAASQATD